MLRISLEFHVLNTIDWDKPSPHYSEGSIKLYRYMWKRITTFLENENVDNFTEEVGLRFLDKEFNFFELEKDKKLTQSIINAFRIVRMLGDFQQHGCILRRYYKQKKLLQNDEFEETLQRYASYCLESDYAIATQSHYQKIAEQFLSFLESQNIKMASEITAKQVSAYINTLLGCSYKTVEQQLCGLRSFFRFLYRNDFHHQDLTGAIPSIKARK